MTKEEADMIQKYAEFSARRYSFDDVTEAVAEIRAFVLFKMSAFDCKRSNLKTFIARMARFGALLHARKLKAEMQRRADIDMTKQLASQQWDDSPLSSLPPKLQSAARLRLLGSSWGQVSKALNLRAGELRNLEDELRKWLKGFR